MLLAGARGLASSQGDEPLVRALQHQQHVWPHRPVAEAVSAARRAIGEAAGHADRSALAALGLDPARPMGRLRSCELRQLARAIRRHEALPVGEGPSASSAAPR